MIKELSEAIDKANVRYPSAYEAGYFAGLEAAEVIIEKAEPRYLTFAQFQEKYGHAPSERTIVLAHVAGGSWYCVTLADARRGADVDMIAIPDRSIVFNAPPDDWTPEETK